MTNITRIMRISTIVYTPSVKLQHTKVHQGMSRLVGLDMYTKIIIFSFTTYLINFLIYLDIMFLT